MKKCRLVLWKSAREIHEVQCILFWIAFQKNGRKLLCFCTRNSSQIQIKSLVGIQMGTWGSLHPTLGIFGSPSHFSPVAPQKLNSLERKEIWAEGAELMPVPPRSDTNIPLHGAQLILPILPNSIEHISKEICLCSGNILNSDMLTDRQTQATPVPS